MVFANERGVSALLVSLFIALMAGFSPVAQGAPGWNFEKLLMPGELIEGHAEYESDCTNCHVSFEKTAQDRLCLDCHETVALDVVQKSGFHGRSAQLADSGCKACHVDHRGRRYDIVQLDTDSFDHRHTEFSLTGKHLKVSCDGCHSRDTQYRDTGGECIDCHEKDDRHKGELGADCVSCHSETGWDDTDFDHASTRFLLRGKHEEVSCKACHPGERYKNIPMQCNSCHAINDIHGGTRGQKCEDCHTEKDWSEILFDHDNDTDFALRGGHDSLACAGCHKSSRLDDSPGKLCLDCHRNDDTHNGNNGEACVDCHDEFSWNKTHFEHGPDANFELAGKHAELGCGACHSGPLDKDSMQTECVACHAYVDVHKGQQGKQCNNCHNEESWRRDVLFDHDLTAFPLLGLHAAAPCEQCHLDSSFKNTSLACESCHKGDDDHRGAQGPHCFNCHTPGGWDLWRFDHASQTDYPLEGAHENLACDACHRQPVRDKVRQSRACISCHRGDDIHAGSYGERCDRCHVSERFGDIQKLLR